MAKFHNLLVIVFVIIRRTHKAHITDRGAKKPTGPKLPDFTIKSHTNVGPMQVQSCKCAAHSNLKNLVAQYYNHEGYL